MNKEEGAVLSKIDGLIFSLFGLFLIIANLLFSLTLEIFNQYFVFNTHPFGFNVPIYIVGIILFLVTISIFLGKIFLAYPLTSTLILSGAVSNFIERAVFGGVRDYIDISIAMINLADIQIWTGVLLLNYQLWIRNK